MVRIFLECVQRQCSIDAAYTLIHDVEEWRKIILSLFLAVNTVIDCNKPHTLFGEQHLCVKANFQIVPSEPAHILYDYRIDIPCLNLGNHFLETLTLECDAAYAVVRKVADIAEAVLPCEVLKVFFLVLDAVALALHFVIS